MKLTKPMFKAFDYIIKGENTLNTLAVAMKKSKYWTALVLGYLKEEGFITKKSNYSLRGSRLIIEVSNTTHAQKLKELIFEYPGISFDDVLTEGRLLFLTAISEDWMDINTASELSGLSKYIIERYRPKLKNRGIISVKNKLYSVNGRAWPKIKDFLIAFKNYANVTGQVRWKYKDEVLYGVNNESLIKDNATGLYSYKDFGVRVLMVSALCRLPKEKLSKEEVFVHSLFEVNDPRTLHLALTFYIKNKLSYKKVYSLTMRYGKYTMFQNFIKIMNSKEEKVKIEGMPVFERSDFKRIANMYGVNNV